MDFNVSESEFDLALAAELQAALLPATCPPGCGHQIAAARNRMSGKVGGDFYDFLQINDEQVAIYIGDVIGHGVRASLLMAKIMGYIQAVKDLARPLSVVRGVNRMLLDVGNRTGHVMLCSLFYAVLDHPSGTMFFANAGHPHPLILGSGTGNISPLGGQTLLLGIDDYEPVEDCYMLSAGERLVLYTDGLVEAIAPSQDAFGEARLEQVLLEKRAASVDQCADGVFDAVARFRGGQKQEDDETIMVIDRLA